MTRVRAKIRNIRSFAEQDIGVPVFAALDGVVTDVHDGEPDSKHRLQSEQDAECGHNST